MNVNFDNYTNVLFNKICAETLKAGTYGVVFGSALYIRITILCKQEKPNDDYFDLLKKKYMEKRTEILTGTLKDILKYGFIWGIIKPADNQINLKSKVFGAVFLLPYMYSSDLIKIGQDIGNEIAEELDE